MKNKVPLNLQPLPPSSYSYPPPPTFEEAQALEEEGNGLLANFFDALRGFTCFLCAMLHVDDAHARGSC